MDKEHQKLKWEASLWMMVYILSYTAVTFIMKRLKEENLPAFFVLGARFIFKILFVFPMLKQQKTSLTVPPWETFRWYLLRALFVYPAMYCTYIAYQELPMAMVTAVGFIEPTMLLFLSVLFLGLKAGSREWFSVSIGYVGILIISGPTLGSHWKGVALALLANLFASASRMINKWLTTTIAVNEVITWTNLLAFPLACIFILSSYPLMVTTGQWFFLFSMSVASFIAQYAGLQAVKRVHFDVIGPLTYLRLPLAAFLSFLLFGEEVDRYLFLGTLLIVVSNYIIIFLKEDKEG